MAVNRVSGSFVWEVGLELGGGRSESGKCVELCEQKRAGCVGGTRARDAGRGTEE